MDFIVDDVLDVSLQRFWNVLFFDREYDRALYDFLRLDPERLVFEWHGEGDDLHVRRRLRIMPRRDIPAFIKTVLRGMLAYEECITLNARERRMDVKVVLPVIGERVDVSGHYEFEGLPGDKLRWRYQGRCVARIPLLGHKIDEFMVGEFRKAMAEVATFTKHWLTAHPTRP